jgi:hypothetical protein
VFLSDDLVLLWILAVLLLEILHLKWIWWEHWRCRRCKLVNNECSCGRAEWLMRL